MFSSPSPFTVPPDILDYPTSTDMVVREGGNVSMRCAASGFPAPSITWRREGGELISVGPAASHGESWSGRGTGFSIFVTGTPLHADGF